MKIHIRNFLDVIEANTNWDAIWKQYLFLKEFAMYEQSSPVFDIFDILEGVPTYLLERLLKYDNYKFLPSFVEKVLGIRNLEISEQIAEGEVVVTSQLEALGNIKGEDTDFIDLTIVIGDEHVIIQNKAEAIENTKWQSSRYAAKILCMGVISPYNEDDQFDSEWYDKLGVEEKEIVDRKLQHLYFYSLSEHANELHQWFTTCVQPIIQNELSSQTKPE